MLVGALPSLAHMPSIATRLVVTTLAGDILVLDANNLSVIWRTNVPGSAGFFNAIRVANLNSDSFSELYVAGSFGIWRFTQPGEITL